MNKNLTLADDASKTIRNVCIIPTARKGNLFVCLFGSTVLVWIGLFLGVLITNFEHYFCLMS